MTLLVECKQRIPDVRWLFFPNDLDLSYPRPTSTNIVRVIDRFFYHQCDRTPVRVFSESLPIAIKGTEINLSKGDVYDKEIRHGNAQLQYALPAFVVQLLRLMALHLPTMFVPYLFCPVLLTTAELYMVKDTTSLADFGNIASLDEIAVRVPYLCYSATIGPDFQNHSKRQGEGLAKEWRADVLAELDQDAEQLRLGNVINASAFIHEVEAGRGSIVDDYYQDIVVCSHAAFGAFLNALEQAVEIAVKTLVWRS